MTDTASASAGDQADPKEEFVLTKEILAFENRRNDLIVAAGVLLFTFFLGSYKETYPDIPLHLATGRIIADSGIPKHDSFSFGAPADKVWINPSWLFDWGLFRAYSAVGDVAVAVVKALAGAAAIGLLIGIRHRGPTLWWTVFCAFFAAVALSPRLFLGSEVVAALLLALLLLCIFQARYAGRFWMIYLAAPITALWANVDLSFFVAPLVLAAFLLGEAIQSVCPKSWRFGESQWQASQLVSVGVVTVLCVLAGAATPFGMATLSFPYDWIVNIAPQAPYNERQFLGWTSLFAPTAERATESAFFYRLLDGNLSYGETAWAALVATAFASFFLNFQKLSIPRVLLAVVAVALPALGWRFAAPSGLMLATILALNGQEWFLLAFGPEPRLEKGWVLWSQAGRFVTILGLFVAVLFAPTGRVVPSNSGLFGYGIADNFFLDKESADWLGGVKLQGKPYVVAAIRLPAAIAWQAPSFKYFTDSRWQLFVDPPGGGKSALQLYVEVQKAMLPENPGEFTVEKAFAKLDEGNFTHIMYDPNRLANRLLMVIPGWTPLHIRDRFFAAGRVNLKPDHPDAAAIPKLRVQPNKLVFDPPKTAPTEEVENPSGLASRFVAPPSFVDWLWRFRYNTPAGYSAGAAWTMGTGSNVELPGAFYMSIRELRKGLVENPDHPDTRLQLGYMYEGLFDTESRVTDYEHVRLLLRADARQRKILEAEDAKAKAANPTKVEPKTPPKSELKNEPKSPAKNESKAAPRNSDGKTAPKAEPRPVDKNEEFSPEKLTQDQLNTLQRQAPLRAQDSFRFLPFRHFQMMSAWQEALRANTPEGISAWLIPAELGRFKAIDYRRIALRAASNRYYDLAAKLMGIAVSRPDVPQEQVEVYKNEQKQLDEYVGKAKVAYDEQVAGALKALQERFPEAAAGNDLLPDRIGYAKSVGLPLLGIAEFEKAPTTHPSYQEARKVAVALYLELGFVDQAREQLDNLTPDAFPQPGDYNYFSAQVMLASGSYDRAREMYSAAINDMRGRRVQLALTSSERLFGVFGPTSLLDQFPDGRYAGVFPDRTDFFLELQRESKTGFELGLLLIEMGKPQEAIKAFKEALEAYPRNPWLPIMRYYAKFIPGAKLPEIPDLAFEADELKVKFDLPPEPPKTPAAGAKDAKPGAAPKGAAEAGKALPTGAAPKGAGPAKQ